MNPDLWKYLDPRGMGITLALSAILVAVVLLITDQVMAHRQKGLRLASLGVICAALGMMLNMLQTLVSPWITLFLGVVWMFGGLSLMLAGVMQLRAQTVPWMQLGLLWLSGIGVSMFFGVVYPDVRWRIGVLSAILSLEAGWLARVAITENRPAFRRGMALLTVFGVVFSALMGLRALAAALGLIASSISLSLVNAGSVIAGGMSLIGGVVGLVFILGGDLRALLEHQAQHDPLTGLLNRQGLRRWLETYSPETELSVVLIDLDHFKNVNDTWGHAAGDAVLVRLSRLLANQCAPSSVAVRMGGEEFVWLWAQPASLQAAASQTEQLRLALASATEPPPTTLSAGVAIGAVASFEATLRQADAALYEAKAGGRNRVVVAPHTPTPL